MVLHKNIRWLIMIAFMMGMLTFGNRTRTLAAEKQEQQAAKFFQQTDSPMRIPLFII